MAYKHDDKSSGQLIRSADWNTMGHAVQDLDTNKVNRAGDTIQGDLSVTGLLKISGARVTNSAGFGMLEANQSDWLRINPDGQYPGIAMYKSIAIENGLSVGAWEQLPKGALKVSDSITVGALKLQASGNASIISNDAGRLHISGGEILYLLNKSGVIVGKEWGGTGNLAVEGNLGASNICSGGAFRIGAGRTPAGSTAWQVYNPNGIMVDVDTRAAGFTQTPVYVVSLGGNSQHWSTTGGTSVYNASNAGFRIYVRWWNDTPLVPATANANQWHIEWIGIQV